MSRKDELNKTAQKAAERLMRDTLARYAIVLLVDGDTIVMGAWVPNEETLADVLRQALSSLDGGTATIIDRRGKGDTT